MIDTIIFDFGGVILDIDYPATSKAFRHLFGDGVEYSQLNQGDLFDRFERGEITPAEFRADLRQAAEVSDISDEMIDQAWNAMLGGIPLARIRLLRELGKCKRLFLLSNTNAIHKQAFDQTLLEVLGEGVFEGLFEAAYYSHLIGRRKPEAEAFNLLIERHDLQPERTLFIDDSPQNIQGAEAVSLKCHHLTEELCVWYEHKGRALIA